jgi:penicillin-binding protein 1A
VKSLGFLSLRLFVSLIGLFVGIGVVAALAVVLVMAPSLPSADSLKDVHLKVPLRVYSADGQLMAEFGEERRIPVHIDKVPPMLIKAVLAAEDDAFYEHRGVDLMGIVRAAIANIRTGEHGQGASTITMQVARNYFLSPEKTYTRKIREILLSFKIERELTKNQILELYLNKIFLGHRAYGFAAAAQVYYGRDLDELTLPELAMLAGLPKAPSRDNPLSNPENAAARRNYVLRRMHKLGFIDDAAYASAAVAPLSASRHMPALDLQAPYVAEMVRQYMVDNYGQGAYDAGYKVYTTIEARDQRAAEKALRHGLLAYDRRHGYRGPVARIDIGANWGKAELDSRLSKYPVYGELVPAVVLKVEDKSVSAYTHDGEIAAIGWDGLEWARKYVSAGARGPAPEHASDVLHLGDIVYLEHADDGAWRLAQIPEIAGALVALRPSDGGIVSLVGGFDFYLSKFNRAVQAERQPGSNIKPFIYSAALEKGFTPATRVSGAPIVVQDVSVDNVWRPENYSGKFFGPTPLRVALMKSLNLVSIRLLRAIGPRYAVDYLTRFGFPRDKLPSNLSLALGTASLTPLQVVSGFAVFANGGFRVEPYYIARIEDSDGHIVEQASPTVICPESIAASEPAVATNQAAPGESSESGSRCAGRAITPENAYVMTTMMHDVITSGTGRRAMALGRNDLAGKTGTTNDYRDAWFSGFNSDLVASVWVGFDHPTTLGRGEPGGRAALPIWVDFMRVALEGDPERSAPPPPGVQMVFINRDSGQPTTLDDPDGYEEYFIASAQEATSPPTEIDEAEAPPPSATLPAVPEEKKIPEGLF